MANLSIGIVGMPNVGKSTLFNALLKKQAALEANYPFATIEPNVGIIEVPDERLPKLAEIVKTNKIVPAVVEFVDIAGLVRGASKGEGLGNKFLAHIREVAAIVHVVRLFEDSDIIHVENKVDPKSDIETIETELILADLQTLSKQREPKGTSASKEAVSTYAVVQRLKEGLNQGIPLRNQKLNDEDREMIQQLNLLTIKPVIYAFNCSLDQLETKEEVLSRIMKYELGIKNLILFNPLEDETLNVLISKAYETLGLISFLTAGEKEVRAWTIQNGQNAVEASGVIHTDFMKKFIKADISSYQDFVDSNGWNGAREKGKVQIVGKDHIMQEGDVVEFKIGA